MSKFFGKKKVSLETKTPRTAEEIQKEYGQLAAQAGQTQYVIAVHQDELKALNDKLRALNQENFNRQQLDAKAAADASKEA